MAPRCCRKGKREVDEALAGIMWADQIPEHAVRREGIFLEAGQISVAFVLLDGGGDEDPQSSNRSASEEGRDIEDSWPVKKGHYKPST